MKEEEGRGANRRGEKSENRKMKCKKWLRRENMGENRNEES